MRLLLPFVFFLMASCGNLKSSKNTSLPLERGPCTNCSSMHFAVDLNSPTKILSQNSTLQNYRSCLGLDRVTPQVMSLYNSIKPSLSYAGNTNSINNSVTFTNIKAAAIACQAFVEQEATQPQRKIFGGIALTATDSLASGSFQGAIEKIARNCWGRDLDQEEMNTIMTDIDQYKTTTPEETKTVAVYICTAMLSTPEAMKQ